MPRVFRSGRGATGLLVAFPVGLLVGQCFDLTKSPLHIFSKNIKLIAKRLDLIRKVRGRGIGWFLTSCHFGECAQQQRRDERHSSQRCKLDHALRPPKYSKR